MKLIAALAAALFIGSLSHVAQADPWPFPFPGFEPNEPAAKVSSEKLPGLNGDSKAVSVSGISAGAYMATQLQVAYSASIMGVGSVAGGPWSCAQGSVITAQTSCMYIPNGVDPKELVLEAKKAAKAGEIDATTNLKSARVYLYNSQADQVVRPPMNEKTQSFYAAFVDGANIQSETSIASAHGFPTIDYGNACGSQGSPFINKCNYDAAGELLRHIYGSRVQTRTTFNAKSFHVIDQTEFGSEQSAMAQTGWVYIPEACRASGAKCPVHVALHGCLQAGEVVKDVFAIHAGYNEWAEGSNVIVLYPQTQKGSDNPNGCFDWWGYTGLDYANKNGPQMKTIKAMIDRVLGS